ncbi:MAG: DNA-binding protein [Ruminococcus sp.]|uniref:YlxM family DNA-binding protein n=1 Tax=Ruminococcus sp. TaxID=41978 RepID=UPI001B5D8E74|nr:sigma factor-like helix-turn-helix DNA-binding protein [Ruminococcus sp.]MBO4493643.1 DNA-binding protein [Ruminococcus sp.]MBP5431261.1 DNA-binding protein [Ruminococcus sp.]
MAKELKFVMLLDCYGDLLTEHQRSIMEMYYCEDLSLAEIGQPLDITRQAVRSIIKRTEDILLNYEEKLGFAERLDKMRVYFGMIESSAEHITDEDIKKEITEDIKKVRELL